MLCLASLVLVTSAQWSGLGVGLSLVLGSLPFLLYFLEQRRAQALIAGRMLVIYPDKPWQLSLFAKDAGAIDNIEVIVIQRWHHLFGLSLHLKLQNCPRFKRQSTTVVVWKHGLSKENFRQVSLQAAQRLEFVGLASKGDAA